MLVEAGHTPFAIVHSKILFPVASVVTPDEFNVDVVTDEPPKTTDHVPVPVIGIFAFNVVVVAQSV